ncbi:hypothetical protein [Streptomyces sp. NPDC088182]|uniref:hypothetical protein n=1 Tax=Streptomyces sp. NPDC088182 TaxID=3365838 RepID=UPI0038153D8E
MTLSHYRGTVVDTDEIHAELDVLARLYPLGIRVRHACGREGVVTFDRWLVWAPLDKLAPRQAQRVNRPSLRLAGGTR